MQRESDMMIKLLLSLIYEHAVSIVGKLVSSSDFNISYRNSSWMTTFFRFYSIIQNRYEHFFHDISFAVDPDNTFKYYFRYFLLTFLSRLRNLFLTKFHYSCFMYADRSFIVLFICLFFFSHLIQLYRFDKKKTETNTTNQYTTPYNNSYPQCSNSQFGTWLSITTKHVMTNRIIRSIQMHSRRRTLVNTENHQ